MFKKLICFLKGHRQRFWIDGYAPWPVWDNKPCFWCQTGKKYPISRKYKFGTK